MPRKGEMQKEIKKATKTFKSKKSSDTKTKTNVAKAQKNKSKGGAF